jgi:hypothetical protein
VVDFPQIGARGMRALLGGLLGAACALAAHAQSADGDAYRPGFTTCAAYFFLAARGHPASRYDYLYSAGEFALNRATLELGRPAAEARMGSDSGVMMREIEQDWRLIERLDRRYEGACEALLRDAHFEAP